MSYNFCKKVAYGPRRLLPPLTAQKVETSSKIMGESKEKPVGEVKLS